MSTPLFQPYHDSLGIGLAASLVQVAFFKKRDDFPAAAWFFLPFLSFLPLVSESAGTRPDCCPDWAVLVVGHLRPLHRCAGKHNGVTYTSHRYHTAPATADMFHHRGLKGDHWSRTAQHFLYVQ